MVPNQRQLFIVVSDWGSYLGSHFPFWCLWVLVLCLVACLHYSYYLHGSFSYFVCLFSVHSYNEEECTHTTLHLGLIRIANVTK